MKSFVLTYMNLNNSLFFRKKFKGITSKPSFCQAIYISFKNQQANAASILTAGEEQTGKHILSNNKVNRCTLVTNTDWLEWWHVWNLLQIFILYTITAI